MSKDDWDTIIKVNLDSVFNLTKSGYQANDEGQIGLNYQYDFCSRR